MSIQDEPFSNPPGSSSPTNDPFGDAAGRTSGTGAGGLGGDLKTAAETARSDLRSAVDVASRDLSSLKEQVGGELSNLSSQAGDQFSSLKREATDQFQSLKQQATEQIGQATEQAKTYATEQVSQLTDKARSFADQQKKTASQQLNGVVDVASRLAGELRNHDQGRVVAPYADSMVDGLRRFADTIENRSVDDLVGMVQDFGRRQPIAFLGVAALAGFAVSRFLMASTARSAREASSEGSHLGAAAYGSDFDRTGATEFGGAGTLDVAVDDARPAASQGGGDYGRI